MAKQITYGEELAKLGKYILSEDNENAKNQYLYPIFQKLFGEKMKTESAAGGADVYIEGRLVVECKSRHSQWLDGFFQALHYHKKSGLVYHTIIVIANKFVGVWKVNKLPELAVILAQTADAQIAPNIIGKENAKKTNAESQDKIKESAIYWLSPKELDDTERSLTIETFAVLNLLKNLEVERFQVNTHNFIAEIEQMKAFFEKEIDAVHAFYTIAPYWDVTSILASDENVEKCQILGIKRSKVSSQIEMIPRKYNAFKKFVENRYIFTNEGSGLSIDYYFSRFDEVLATIDPEFVEQHGIFFTDHNLSKFTLWYLKYHFGIDLSENYYVFDPAGG